MNLSYLIGILGHELRTPLAAILGYQELLADGIYGEIDEKKHEPIERIQQSAQQLLHLIDGLQELAGVGTPVAENMTPTKASELLAMITTSARPFAAGRTVELHTGSAGDDVELVVLVQRFLRAADLALVAAIKNSAGKTLKLDISPADGGIVFTIDGTGLDATRDNPETIVDALQGDRQLSAAQLRLAMASATLAVVKGSVRLSLADGATRVELRVPS